jgi:hypothetical protein
MFGDWRVRPPAMIRNRFRRPKEAMSESSLLGSFFIFDFLREGTRKGEMMYYLLWRLYCGSSCILWFIDLQRGKSKMSPQITQTSINRRLHNFNAIFFDETTTFLTLFSEMTHS